MNHTDEGTNGAWRRVRDVWTGSSIFVVMLMTVNLLLSPTPRNPDNSMRAEFLTPAFAVVAVIVTLLLWRGPRYWPLRFACWWMVAISYSFTLGGVVVLLIKAFD